MSVVEYIETRNSLREATDLSLTIAGNRAVEDDARAYSFNNAIEALSERLSLLNRMRAQYLAA